MTTGQRHTSVGRPSLGDRSLIVTHLPAEVWNAVNARCPAPGQFGNTVAQLAHLGLQHAHEAVITAAPDGAITTRTRLPRPDRNKVDELKKAVPGSSLGTVVAALVAVGLRYDSQQAHAASAASGRQEVLMPAS